MASLLNEVARTGTGAKAQATLKRPDIYGKTGTTNDAVDTWFAGFQPKITTVVWMGRDDNTSLGAREFGATLALPIWIDYMRAALKNEPVVTLQAPGGVQEVQGDWLYDEFVGGGYISYLGMEPGNPPSVQVAGSPRDAAPARRRQAAPAPRCSRRAPTRSCCSRCRRPRRASRCRSSASRSKAPASAPVQEPYQHLAPSLR